MRNLRSILFLALVLLLGQTAHAIEIHSFLMPACEVSSGILIHIDDDKLTLLKLDGSAETLNPKQIHGVFVTSVLDNPIEKIVPSSEVTRTLREITIGNETFLGWPVRFVESLVVFFDVSGRTRVYEREAITRIRPLSSEFKAVAFAGKPTQGLKQGIDLRELSSECPSIGSGNGLRPNRIMVDQIKVDQYLSDLTTGHADLAAYQERTYLYARPLLFDQKTRLNFNITPEASERNLLASGMGVQWASGKPFHFQSFTHLGTQYDEMSPYVQPFFGFRSDMKAHVFHLHVSGDLRGLSGGSPVFSTNGDLNDKTTSEGQIGMNYLLLMGGDYGPVSLSAGFFYPSHFMKVGDTYREIRANRQSLAYRAMWTTRTMRWFVLYSAFNFNSDAPTDDDYSSNGPNGTLSNFSLKGQFLRGGWSWDVDELTRLSLDGTMNSAKYSGRAKTTQETFDLQRWALSATARRDFGDYVGLSLTATWLFIDRTYSPFLNYNNALTGDAGHDRQNPVVIGGQIEIIL